MSRSEKPPSRWFDENLKSPSGAVDELVIVGIDAEWQPHGVENHLISFQWSVLHRGNEATGISILDGRRPTFRDLMQKVLGDARRQGLFSHYPKSVYLISHFSLAELTILADFQQLKTRFDAIRTTYATLTDSLDIRITDKNRNQRTIAVYLRDSMLLTPQGAALKVLGEIHGVPKVELPPGAIENMAELLKSDPDLFARYAITDARISAIHAFKMAELNQELTGQCTVPVTLGGLGMAFAIRWWKERGIDIHAVLGKEVVTERSYNPKAGQTWKRKKSVLTQNLHEHEALAVEAYHGGRNEAFQFGPSPIDDYMDVDLCGAYSTALASAGMPMWEQLRPTTQVEDFTAGVIGLARIRFHFPGSVRFPCLPVRLPNNLIFPLEGETHATSPEIQLAVVLGAKIEILSGIVIPMDDTIRPFEEIIAEYTRRRIRAKEEGDDLGNRLYKEMANSLYGKIAQGLREKRVFDSRSGERKDIPPSKLTQPYIAAYVTGLVRAALGELLNGIPEERTIVSVTTDGFITNATLDQLGVISNGPACSILRETRQRLVQDPTVLEVKHRARQVLCFRTRGQATLLKMDNADAPLLAKAGIKPPRAFVNKDEQNEWMIRQFFDRNPDSSFTYESLRTLRSLYDEGGDLIMERHERRLGMEFDFKRKPTLRWMGSVDGFSDHLAFTTQPFKNVEECEEYREGWRRFRESGRCLKTKQDLRVFEEFLAGNRLRQHGLNRSSEGLTRTAMQQFTRRLVRGVLGLDAAIDQYSYQELAEKLSASGLKVTATQLKNAKRPGAKPKQNSIPRTPEVMELVYFLLEVFPGWDAEEMLENEGAPVFSIPEAAQDTA